MAVLKQREEYTHAMIDTSDMTLTEFGDDGVRIFEILDILKRWDGLPDITLSIRRKAELEICEE